MEPLTESYLAGPSDGEIEEITVGDALRRAAALWPDKTAFVEASADGAIGRSWTYKQLLADAERLALALLTRYAPGERICVWAPNSLEWVLLEFAAGLAGLTLVTANPAYRPRELKFVLEQSRSVGLFMVREYRGNPMAEIAAEVAAELADLREVVDVTDPAALFRRGAGERPLPHVRPNDPAQIQYTSGTTGFPKGAVLHHRGILNNARITLIQAGVRIGDVVMNYMPMFHTSGCGLLTLGTAQMGCKTIICSLFNPPIILGLMESQRVEMSGGVPTMLIALLEAQAAQPRDLSSIRVMFTGGAMVAPETVRQVTSVFGCSFSTVFGQTESSPVVTQTLPTDTLEDTTDTVGRPMPHTEISIRDANTNAVVGVGRVGEICARGYCVMLGYNDNPEANAKAIDADGWLHTGDLGTMDARGCVRVTGRVKEMIIRGGENLFPAEIENILLEHPDVAEVAVVGVPDPHWGESVACFVRPAAGADLDVASLRAHCRANLAPQKTPAHWIAMTEWPMTGSGKIQKFVLRDRFVAGDFA
jgi:long-chain acyl-CoA synthetase